MNDTEMTPKVVEQLASLALRFEHNPDFMAWVLAVYRKREHLDNNALADQLMTSNAMLVRLALCKRPNSTSAQFAAQVQQIAAYTHIAAAQLANVLRQVESLEALSQRPQSIERKGTQARQMPRRSGLLAAARDREESEEEQPESPDTSDTSKNE